MKNILLVLAALVSTSASAALPEVVRVGIRVDLAKCYASEGYSSCDGSALGSRVAVVALSHCGRQPAGEYCNGEYAQVDERDGLRVLTRLLIQKWGDGASARYSLLVENGFEGGAPARTFEIELGQPGVLTDAVRFRGAETTLSRDGAVTTYLSSVLVSPAN